MQAMRAALALVAFLQLMAGCAAAAPRAAAQPAPQRLAALALAVPGGALTLTDDGTVVFGDRVLGALHPDGAFTSLMGAELVRLHDDGSISVLGKTDDARVVGGALVSAGSRVAWSNEDGSVTLGATPPIVVAVTGHTPDLVRTELVLVVVYLSAVALGNAMNAGPPPAPHGPAAPR